MNKIIFQIGVLGFCVATVLFGTNGGSILDIVSRAFIVFVGVVLAVTMIVLVGGTMMERNRLQHAGHKEAAIKDQQQ